MPTGPPMAEETSSNGKVFVLHIPKISFNRPFYPFTQSKNSADIASWRKVLTKGAKKTACASETNGAIDKAIPRITVSNAQVIPAKIPHSMVMPPL